MTTQVGDIITQAIAELDEHGWTAFANLDIQGRMCAVGAICKVLTGSAVPTVNLSREKYYPVIDALFAQIPDGFDALALAGGNEDRLYDYWWREISVVNYNNSRDSYTEVRGWFEKAALNEGVSLCPPGQSSG